MPLNIAKVEFENLIDEIENFLNELDYDEFDDLDATNFVDELDEWFELMKTKYPSK